MRVLERMRNGTATVTWDAQDARDAEKAEEAEEAEGRTERFARLTAMRREAESTIEAMDGQILRVTAARADANSDDEHDPEGATIAFERSQADALRLSALDRLQQIHRALNRMHDGVEERCAVCGDRIPAARLAARPFTTTCVRHA